MHRVRDQGSAVMSFGKLHFRSSNDDNGFTEEHLPMHVVNDGLGWPQALIRNPLPPFEESVQLAARVGANESEYTLYDRKIQSAATKWLRTYQAKLTDQPWVLFVSFVSPHFPLTAPKEFYGRYADCQFNLPAPAGEASSIRHPVVEEIREFWNYDDYFDDSLRREAIKCYFGLVSFLDDNIRQLLSAVEDAGNLDNTLVIYISDHGEMLGQYGFWTKSLMYERSVGIPLIAAGPGFRASRCSVPVSLTDIGATVHHALGIRTRENAEPWKAQALQKISADGNNDRFMLSQYHDGGSPVSFYMVRHGDWKYIHYAGGHSPQLFNLSMEPSEAHDFSRIPRYEKVVDEMDEKLKKILDPEETARICADDQARKVARLGGRDAVLAMGTFGHTPIEGIP